MKTKSNTKLFDRLAQLTGSSATTLPSASGAQAAATSAFQNLSGRLRAAAAGTGSSSPTGLMTPPPQSMVPPMPTVGMDVPSEEEGKLNLDMAEKMLKWHAEAVGRCVELSVPSDLCVFLFHTLGYRFSDKAFQGRKTSSRS